MAKRPFIAKIDSLLAERGIAKKDFYRDCEITSATYSQWNTGKTKPRIYSLQKIADYLGVSFADIAIPFHNNDEPEQKEKSPTPEGMEQIPGYEGLSEENKVKARDFIAFLLSQQ